MKKGTNETIIIYNQSARRFCCRCSIQRLTQFNGAYRVAQPAAGHAVCVTIKVGMCRFAHHAPRYAGDKIYELWKLQKCNLWVYVCECACASECVSYSGHFCVVEQIYSMICTQNVHNALAESGQNRIKPSTSNVGIVLLSSQLKY